MKLFILISILIIVLLFILFSMNSETIQDFYVEPGTVQGGWNFSDFRKDEISSDISDYNEDSELYS